MTENILGKPFDASLQRMAHLQNITVTETAAPVKGDAVPKREGVPHVVAVRQGEWVIARFPVGLPRKEGEP